MNSGAIVIAALALLTATAASAEGNRVGNNVGVGNAGAFNGNMNANGNAASSANYSGYNGADANGGTVNNNNNYRTKVPGAIGMPGLAAGSGACLGSFSIGASLAAGSFGGAGFGKTYLEKNCEARAVADQLFRYGYKKAAVQVLLDNHSMANRAMTEVGSARRR